MTNTEEETMKKALITGSFDPITSGHVDLILRSSALFDEVYVVILANTEKQSGTFSPAERLELLEEVITSLPCKNVKAALHGGLTSDFANKVGATFIVRGARSAADFDYEYNLSLIMKRFDPTLETIILPTAPHLSAISSTYVRDLLKYGCELGDAVPSSCKEKMIHLYKQKQK